MILTLIQASNASVNGSFEASVTPSVFNELVTNGSYITPFFEVETQNEVGSVEYEWSVESGDFSVIIDGQGTKRVRLSMSAVNLFVNITLKCKAVDTGNSNNEADSSAIINLKFGENL